MVTTGMQLIKDLKLTKFKSILMTRCLVTSFPIYMIFIDSRFPYTPLTSGRIFSSPMPTMVYSYPFSNKVMLTPLFDIKTFNGDIRMGIFFVVDISGYMGNPSMRESINLKEIYNYIYASNLNSLLEALTIDDLKSNAASSLNKKFLNLRKSDGASGSILTDVKWDEETDTITLDWQITPTYSQSVTNYTPELESYTDNKYLAQIQFVDVSKFLGKKETYKEFTPSEQSNLVSDMIKNGEIKVWSSDPSFYFQGAFESMSDLDASIYDFPGPASKNHIWAKRHGTDIHVSKHILEILKAISFNASNVSKRLRES